MTQNQTVQISDSRRAEFNQLLDVLKKELAPKPFARILHDKSETLPQLCRSRESRSRIPRRFPDPLHRFDTRLGAE